MKPKIIIIFTVLLSIGCLWFSVWWNWNLWLLMKESLTK